MTLFNAESPVLSEIAKMIDIYLKAQEEFTRGTRSDQTTGAPRTDGWTSATLEWGKPNKDGVRMKPLQQILEEKFPEEVGAFGAAGLLKLVATKTGRFRVVDREATWTPKRGANRGKIQAGLLHDVFIPTGAGRPVYDPFTQKMEASVAPQAQ